MKFAIVTFLYLITCKYYGIEKDWVLFVGIILACVAIDIIIFAAKTEMTVDEFFSKNKKRKR